jgi:hypothetical protein
VITKKKKKNIVSVRVIGSIYCNEFLMLFKTYMESFDLLILQGFHIKQEELIGQKSILILESIRLLFNKDSLTIIFFGCFSLSYMKNGENDLRLLLLLLLLLLFYVNKHFVLTYKYIDRWDWRFP